jgi:hypothetical protein
MPRLRDNAYTRASKALSRDERPVAIPSEEAVGTAIQEKNVYVLLRWNRFCHGPGAMRIGKPDFEEVLQREARVVEKIVAGLAEVRGWIEGHEDGK